MLTGSQTLCICADFSWSRLPVAFPSGDLPGRGSLKRFSTIINSIIHWSRRSNSHHFLLLLLIGSFPFRTLPYGYLPKNPNAYRVQFPRHFHVASIWRITQQTQRVWASLADLAISDGQRVGFHQVWRCVHWRTYWRSYINHFSLRGSYRQIFTITTFLYFPFPPFSIFEYYRILYHLAVSNTTVTAFSLLNIGYTLMVIFLKLLFRPGLSQSGRILFSWGFLLLAG